MTVYVQGSDLASYLERDESSALSMIADWTNALVDEEWTNPTDPVPQWVVNIARKVAIRAAQNPNGVTSTTRSWDDITRTDRYEAGQEFGVYLDDDDKTKLNSANQTLSGPPPSISVRMPGITTAPGLPLDGIWPWSRSCY